MHLGTVLGQEGAGCGLQQRNERPWAGGAQPRAGNRRGQEASWQVCTSPGRGEDQAGAGGGGRKRGSTGSFSHHSFWLGCSTLCVGETLEGHEARRPGCLPPRIAKRGHLPPHFRERWQGTPHLGPAGRRTDRHPHLQTPSTPPPPAWDPSAPWLPATGLSGGRAGRQRPGPRPPCQALSAPVLRLDFSFLITAVIGPSDLIPARDII